MKETLFNALAVILAGLCVALATIFVVGLVLAIHAGAFYLGYIYSVDLFLDGAPDWWKAAWFTGWFLHLLGVLTRFAREGNP